MDAIPAIAALADQPIDWVNGPGFILGVVIVTALFTAGTVWKESKRDGWK